MKRWIKSFLYIPKHTKPTDENILRLLLPSFVGIFLCMICLAGTTWAWFTASVQTQPQTITAASFDIEVTVDGKLIEVDISLMANTEYKITLTATGTAPSGGYCVVQTSDTKLYTVPLKPGDSLIFTLTPEKEAVYTFTAVWGRYSGIDNVDIIGEKAEVLPTPKKETRQQTETGSESIHVVQSGDSLWKIARQYGTTVELLATYNGIEDADKIQIGDMINIPSADYKLPKNSAVSSTQPASTESGPALYMEPLSEGETPIVGDTTPTEVNHYGTHNITSE